VNIARERKLVIAGVVFAVGSACHVIDHLRRGQGSVTETLYVMGNLGLVLQVVTITLVVTRHRFAALVAVAAGTSLAIGFGAAHWLPTWSSLSDPVWEIESLAWLSYAASAAEIAGAVAVATTGLAIVRDNGLPDDQP
jgi:hypothetical protein